jgi:hypothetical protein
MSRLCEEFHCLPSEAYREWRTVREGLLEEILEARAFASIKQASDRGVKYSDMPSSPLLAWFKLIESGQAENRDLWPSRS